MSAMRCPLIIARGCSQASFGHPRSIRLFLGRFQFLQKAPLLCDINCFTSSDSWFSPSLNRAYSNRILHSSTAPSGMLISGAGGSNFPATTAELCTAYCLFYCWGLWCLCVNCASARYHLSPLPLKQNCGENRLKLCLPQKGQPHHGLCYSG
jgi:hypothetical protein